MTQVLVSRFTEIAAAYAGKPAIILPVDGDAHTVTYADLDRRRLEIADALIRSHRVAPGDSVGLLQSQQTDTLAAMLGIITIGANYVPLDPELPQERLNFILKDANVRLRLTAEQQASDCWVQISSLQGQPRTFEDVTPETCVYIMYTSGSTGMPKGVMIPHRAVYRLVVDTDFMNLDCETRFLQLAPQAFDAATIEIWGPLLNGGTLVMYPEKVADPETLRNVLTSQKVNALWLTAALFNQFVSRWPDVLDSVDTLLFGGERASVPHVRAAFERYSGTTLINGYGPTENTTFTCCHTVCAGDVADGASDLPIGLPISGTKVKIVDPEGNPVPKGATGELLAGGAGVALGYLNRKELTSASFFTDEHGERWYRTGDLASEREDGAILYFGRMDRQLKISGHRIEPGEIEAAIMAFAEVRNTYVIAKETPKGDVKLVAYIVGEVDKAELRTQLGEELPHYMVPSVFVAIDELPVTKNGKVDTASLPNPFEDAPKVDTLPDGGELANMIASIWAEAVSGLALTSFDENFFDVGGTSMDMLRIKEMLDTHLARDIPAVSLFTYPTINKLAAHLSQDDDSPSSTSDIQDRARQRRQNLARRKKTKQTV
jgi:amino acid adenylation domain-containing protein